MAQDSLVARLKNRFTNQAIPTDLKLSKDAIVSLIIHACFQFGASMSGLFLNLYLWRLTGDFTINAVYNMINFAITPIAFAVGGLIAKKMDRMVLYRLGIMLHAIFYLLVVLAGTAVPQYYILFAVIGGIASGFYWTGYIVLQYDVSNERNRLRYLAFNMIAFNSAGLVGPALAGFIIQRMNALTGYIIIFMLAFIMFVVAAIISMRIKAIENHHRTYYLKYVGLLMKKNRQWLGGLFSFFFLGLFQGIMLFLPNILLFRALNREDLVGFFGVLFAAIVVGTGFVISRKAREEHARKYIFYSISCVVGASCMLLFGVELWSVIVFMVVYSIGNPLLLNSLTSQYFRSISQLPLKGQLRVEAVVVRELFLNVGRVIAIAVLIIFASDLESIWLPIIMVTMASAQFFIMFCLPKKRKGVEHVTSA